ncbi:hypothetical protein CLV51_101159 [Chitinophaga niastensis]|uniref:Uncharacterized protein n=1 Tax=Chitinophaga niastensis TaxID=536980 RepID=A0A2P8HRI2_CHINA|nr:hypothetical protein [Chitinophaga niastensis]PSL48831.1 hypothetical protein CLV51_101159 [Chitinophaga niastensis]
MNKLHTTAITQMQAISIGQIIMDDSNYLTLWGQVQQNNVWYSCDFVTTYEVMNTMLRYNQEKHHHDAVLMTIVKKLEDMRRVPDIIDLEAELGDAVVFDNMTFHMRRPCLQQDSNWEAYADEECYYIERVIPLPTVPTLPPAARTDISGKMEQCIQLLADTYDLYLGFIEIELEDEAARVKAGLENDKKFSMAYYAWQLHTSNLNDL